MCWFVVCVPYRIQHRSLGHGYTLYWWGWWARGVLGISGRRRYRIFAYINSGATVCWNKLFIWFSVAFLLRLPFCLCGLSTEVKMKRQKDEKLIINNMFGFVVSSARVLVNGIKNYAKRKANYFQICGFFIKFI